MLNALANHGYLPRDGKDISLARLVIGLQESINFAPDATLFAGVIGLRASTTGNPLSFHLDDLATHGGQSANPSHPPSPSPFQHNPNPTPNHANNLHPPVIEHDGSLSRHDIHTPPPLNNNTEFAPEVWTPVFGHFRASETISIEAAADARRERVEMARETADAAFAMSVTDRRASVLETCLYLRVFGEGVEGGARREWVRVLFGEFCSFLFSC
jgi:hypothetical protein